MPNHDFAMEWTPEMPFDVVDEASAESFPASDPPNWATGQRRGEPTAAIAPEETNGDRVIGAEPAPGEPPPAT